jgi:hypothetical protein
MGAIPQTSRRDLMTVCEKSPHASSDDAAGKGLLSRRIQKFGEWVLVEGHGGEGVDFLEALEASRDERFHAGTLRRVELCLAEWAFHRDGRKAVVEDELGEEGVAFQVAFGGGEKIPHGDLADDETQVEIALGDVLDLVAADFAEIPLITLGHASASIVVS